MKKVTYLGIAGSHSFNAAQKYFRGEINMTSSKSISEIFKKIADHTCDAAIVPLENTTTGSISETYDLLLETNLSIIGEIVLKIHHQLLTGDKKGKLSEIKYCYSHPQAISQCETFLERHPKIKPLFTSDTATAGEFIAKRKKPTEAAIAAASAAKFYDLKILAKNIEDNKNNFTRFVVLGPKPNKTGNKISIAFSVAHVPGSLVKALRAYADNNLNLMDIESRPLFGKPWEYIFYVDFEIKNQEEKLKKTLNQMKENCNFLTVLGRYKKGKVYET